MIIERKIEEKSTKFILMFTSKRRALHKEGPVRSGSAEGENTKMEKALIYVGWTRKFKDFIYSE